jgi:hypothetical protein
MEYLDLFTGLIGKQSEPFKKFCENIFRPKEHIETGLDLYQEKILEEQVNEILNTIDSPNKFR